MPGLNDYDDAIRAGKYRFMDANLKKATPVMVKRPTNIGFVDDLSRGQGSFAVAYKLRMPMPDGQMRAARCFLTEKPPQAQRYRVLSDKLPARLGVYTAKFRYVEQGIRVRSNGGEAPYPVMDMEWIEGRELLSYVAEHASAGHAPQLKALCEAWLKMLEHMRANQVAHGDLSGKNVMVRDNGALVLVDYDGVYIPELANMPSPPAGVPGYQHPTAREKRVYGPEMDRFSAMLIYVALRALQERPALWRSHSVYNARGALDSDYMLFEEKDLKSPATSALFRDLLTLQDPLTRRLVEALKTACTGDISRTPWVPELIDPEFAQKAALAALKASIAADNDREIVRAATDQTLQGYAPARAHDQRVDIARENLRWLPAAEQTAQAHDDAKLLDLWTHLTETATTRHLKVSVDAARARMVALTQLKATLASDDYPLIEKHAQTLKGSPALAPFEPQIKEAWVRHERINGLKRALDAGKDDLAVRLWGLAHADPKLHTRLESFDVRVAQARKRVEQVKEAHDAIDARDDERLAQLWSDIKDYPAAQSLAEEANASRERIAALPALTQALDEGRVEAAVRLWNQHKLEGRRLVTAIAQRYHEARQRWIERVDPRNISVNIRDGKLAIRWEWPEDIEMVAVAVDTAMFPSSPKDTDPRCSRADYERNGVFRVPVSSAERYFVRLFSLIRENSGWRASPGLLPSASTSISRERMVYYEIGRSPEAGVYLRVRSADTSPLPTLLIYAQSGQKLLTPSGAQLIARIDERLDDARRGQVSVSLAHLQGGGAATTYLRVFPAEHDPGVRIIGRPTDNIEMPTV